MLFQNADFHIFFDDGDVLNNNKIRGKQWGDLIGDFMVPRFGGTPEDWATANTKVIEYFVSKGIPTLMTEHKEKSHKQFIEWFRVKWVNDMFDYVGVDRPNQADYVKIYYETAEFVDSRVRSAYPGVNTTIKNLYHKGFNLHTSSGTESIELNYYLQGMGIRHYFKKLYGPDLVNILKVDEKFFIAIMKDLKILPKQAIFIDDKPYFLNQAKKTGAYIIQACFSGEFEPEFEYAIKNIKELPEIIEKITLTS